MDWRLSVSQPVSRPNPKRSPWKGVFCTLTMAALMVTAACAGPAAAPPSPTKGTAPAAATQAPVSSEPAKAVAPADKTQSAATKTQAPEVSTLRIGILPTSGLTPMYIADKLGYFKEEGLTIEQTSFASGAQSLSALSAGKLDIVFAAGVSVFQGKENGFDFTILGAATTSHMQPPDSNAMMISADSPFKTAKDLESKRIGVNVLNSVNWLFARALLKKNGANPDKAQYVEIPFPQMGDALLNGRLDAITPSDPFTAVLLAGGKTKVLSYYFVEVQPGFEIAQYVAMAPWVVKNPIAVEKFVNAVVRGADYFRKNESEGRKYLAEFTKMDPALVNQVTPDEFRVRPIDVNSLQKTADLMLEHGLLKAKMDVTPLVYKTAR